MNEITTQVPSSKDPQIALWEKTYSKEDMFLMKIIINFYLDQVLKLLILLQQQLVMTDRFVVSTTEDTIFLFHPLSIFT